jgi:hypothetical protein
MRREQYHQAPVDNWYGVRVREKKPREVRTLIGERDAGCGRRNLTQLLPFPPDNILDYTKPLI